LYLRKSKEENRILKVKALLTDSRLLTDQLQVLNYLSKHNRYRTSPVLLHWYHTLVMLMVILQMLRRCQLKPDAKAGTVTIFERGQECRDGIDKLTN
jgi:hypothetical protein